MRGTKLVQTLPAFRSHDQSRLSISFGKEMDKRKPSEIVTHGVIQPPSSRNSGAERFQEPVSRADSHRNLAHGDVPQPHTPDDFGSNDLCIPTALTSPLDAEIIGWRGAPSGERSISVRLDRIFKVEP